MEGVVAKTVDGRKVELFATILASIGLENDGLGSQMINLVLELHDALEMFVDRLLVLLNLLLLLLHPLEQVLLDRINGQRAVLGQDLDDHQRREKILLLNICQDLHDVLFAVEFFTFAEILKRLDPEIGIVLAIAFASVQDVQVVVVLDVVLQDALMHSILLIQEQESSLRRDGQLVVSTWSGLMCIKMTRTYLEVVQLAHDQGQVDVIGRVCQEL